MDRPSLDDAQCIPRGSLGRLVGYSASRPPGDGSQGNDGHPSASAPARGPVGINSPMCPDRACLGAEPASARRREAREHRGRASSDPTSLTEAGRSARGAGHHRQRGAGQRTSSVAPARQILNKTVREHQI